MRDKLVYIKCISCVDRGTRRNAYNVCIKCVLTHTGLGSWLENSSAKVSGVNTHLIHTG